MFWLIGIIAIFVIALVIIKLTINSDKNPDSNLGILEHPSTFIKQDIEMVDENLVQNNERDS